MTIDSTTELDVAVAAAHARYAAARPRSAAADARARHVLPGGNTRSVLDFEPFPFRVATAAGAELVDIDGHRYLDLCGNYTAGLLGHSPAAIRDAVVTALDPIPTVVNDRSTVNCPATSCDAFDDCRTNSIVSACAGVAKIDNTAKTRA